MRELNGEAFQTMRSLLISAFLLSIVFCGVDARMRHFNGTRRHRSMPIFPHRNERSPANCGPREYHVRCGPERHCDKSCDNLYSPPNCFTDTSNPKCYFPRCLCKEGFVRDTNGKCIRPSHCPNIYLDHTENGSGDVEFRMLRKAKLRGHRRHIKKQRQDNFFW